MIEEQIERAYEEERQHHVDENTEGDNRYRYFMAGAHAALTAVGMKAPRVVVEGAGHVAAKQ